MKDLEVCQKACAVLREARAEVGACFRFYGTGRPIKTWVAKTPAAVFHKDLAPQDGMLMQIDGSHHPWLEERGPKLVVLLAVDDVTGAVAQAEFRTGEDTRGYLVLLEGLIQRWGIPLALYSDRHAAFNTTPARWPVLVESTQFARVIRELGIQQIFALSPQAKGRVEGMAETFQDRLVTELRLAGASTIVEANEVLQHFLPRFNAKFAIAAEHSEIAYRPVSAELTLTETVCIKHTRKVARDNTVKYHWRVLQLLPRADRPSPPGGGLGTGRRRADHQVPRRDRRFSGGTAALLSAVGNSQYLLPRPGTAGGRRWCGQ